MKSDSLSISMRIRLVQGLAMQKFYKWILPGLLTVISLTACAGLIFVELVQNDLVRKLEKRILADHPSAAFEVVGRDLKLSVSAYSSKLIDDAMSKAESIYGVRVVDLQAQILPLGPPFVFSNKIPEKYSSVANVELEELAKPTKTADIVEVSQKKEGKIEKPNPPVMKPFNWTILKNQSGIVLSGGIVSDDERKEIARLVGALFRNVTVEDKQVLASGAPRDLAGARLILVRMLNKLTTGQGDLIDEAISVSGKAISQRKVDRVTGHLNSKLPENFTGSYDIRVQYENPEGNEQ